MRQFCVTQDYSPSEKMANWTEDESLNKFIKEKEIKKDKQILSVTKNESVTH